MRLTIGQQGECLKINTGKGNQFAWTKNHINIDSIPASAPKKSLPLMGLWNSKSGSHMIAADFDSKVFTQFGLSKEMIIRDLIEHVDTNEALVTLSPSGTGVKVLFRVELINTHSISSKAMTAPLALRILKALLPVHLYKLIDKSTPALSLAFISSDMARMLDEWLPRSWPKQICVKDLSVNTIVTHLPKLYSLTDSQWLSIKDTLISRFQAGNASSIMRIILATHRLVSKEGFALSQVMIAEQVGCSVTVVQRLLKSLRDEGVLIEERNGAYKPGVTAKTYTAAGWLFNLIKECIKLREPNRQNKLNKKLRLSRITEIVDGEFNKQMLFCVWAFDTAEEFLEFITQIPGFWKKRCRLREAKAFAKWHFRKRATQCELSYGT